MYIPIHPQWQTRKWTLRVGLSPRLGEFARCHGELHLSVSVPSPSPSSSALLRPLYALPSLRCNLNLALLWVDYAKLRVRKSMHS